MIRLLLLRIRVIFFKELAQAVRDPRLRFLMIGPPILQLIAFGYAANLDLKNIQLAVYDEDRTPMARDLVSAFSSSGYFKIVRYIQNEADMVRTVDSGEVKAVTHLGPGLAGKVNSGRTGLVQIVVTGTNSNTASLVQSYSSQIIEGFNRARLKERLA
ncbi:MAG: ABC transporter permease, partial [Deltaproteobacteria bacterium]|nr:ABC transporter permease [Deltaproteobacteria bacterium]